MVAPLAYGGAAHHAYAFGCAFRVIAALPRLAQVTARGTGFRVAGNALAAMAACHRFAKRFFVVHVLLLMGMCKEKRGTLRAPFCWIEKLNTT
jgi:hypothetical protein